MSRQPRRWLARTATVAALLAGAACGADAGPAAPTEKPPIAQAQTDIASALPAVTSEPSAPVSLQIAGSSAPTDAVATDATGSLYPPQDVSRLGWWVDSSLPGSGTGVVVIAGHINSSTQGDGFAQRFTGLREGEVVTLTGADRAEHRYRVTSVSSIGKGELPVDELNRTDGPETLALITCGGEFVGPPLGYANNDIVLAVPA